MRMEQSNGSIIKAIITDENEHSFFVQKNGETFQFVKNDTTKQYAIGDIVEGFVYENTQRKPMFTTQLPFVQKGKFSWATVTQVRRDLGVFVDIGLPDKEVVVSLDELPAMTELWPKKQNKLYVELKTDKKNRLWATIADDGIIKSTAKFASIELLNKDIVATVYRLKVAGTFVYTQDGYLGFLHPSERSYEPTLGEEIQARIIGVRPDGVLNISMRPRAYQAIPEDAAMILKMLELHPDHLLPYGDKSSPEDIQRVFGISKGQFKRALGHLLKEKKIVQVQNTIRLVEDEGGMNGQ